MLKPLDRPLFERYADFAYSLALDPLKSGYPVYYDGIKTRKEFIDRAEKSFSRDNEEILLFERNGSVAGWIHYYNLPEDNYLDTCAFCIAEGMGDAVREFVSFAQTRFPGTELFLGFPKENKEAAEALKLLGFEIIEESHNDVLSFDDYSPLPEPGGILPVTRENYSLFSRLHAQVDGDMYWNSERIYAHFDNWRVFASVRPDEGVSGAIYYQKWEGDPLLEIFGVDFPGNVYDGAVFRDLLAAVLNKEKREDARHMVFFSEEESQQDALDCGFRCVGDYICYKKEL